MDLLSEKEKETIAGRARTLQERLERRAGTVEGGDVDESVDEYVAEWRENVAGGDPEAFQRRLDREGLDVEECRRRVADDGWPDDEPLPEWVHRLDDVLSFVREHPDAEVVGDRTPFVGLLDPVLAYASEQVADAPAEHVLPSAVDDLVRSLAGRVAGLWSHTLFIEFKTFVASRDPDLVFDDDVEIPEGSTRYYDQFVDEYLETGMREFFLEYSFLGRLIVSLVRQWVARVEEFYDRVTRDWATLGETFGDGRPLPAIAGVHTSGDPHQDGREVYGVEFESGQHVAYKPRNAGLVVGFYELLEWINDHGDLPDLRTLEFVHRDDYVWMEWVEPEACASESEVVQYYRRAGMHVCLFYALAATDMHFENIVAEGGQPVSIDLETLAEPVAKPEMRAITETVTVVAGTIVRTGVIPRHIPNEEFGDMGGFSVQRGEIRREGQQFTDPNTDRMDLVTREYPDQEGSNLPEYEGEVVGPRDHADAIADGFEAMYRFLLDHEAALLADDGPVAGLTDREARVRVLYRSTAIYSQVTNSLSSPDYLRTGVPFGVRSESLAKLVVIGDVDEAVWAVYEAERDVLRNYNSPRFTAKLDSADIFDRDAVVVGDFFVQRPVDQIRDRIRDLDEADLEEQLEYIEWGYGGSDGAHTRAGEASVEEFLGDRGVEGVGSVDASGDGEALDAPGGVESADEFAGAGSVAVSTDDASFERAATDAATAVFDRVVENASTDGGDPTWVLRELGPDGGLHVHTVEDRLHDGRVGIGLFAAGLAAALGDDRYGEFARETVAPVVRAVEAGTFENDPDSVRFPPRPIGGSVGLGSIVYGLTKTGVLLDAPEHLSAAAGVAAILRPERIEDDDRYDVLHGSAGAILGLLALHDATGDDDAMERATLAGEHLVENADDYDGALAWPSPHLDEPLLGFSHGVAGIAYALARLADATGRSRFRRVARDAVAYENRQYDPEVRNWPDLRTETESDWFDGWCHGRTGIGLARLGMHESDADPALRRDVDRALDGVDPGVAYATDHLCCGNFGRVEFLLRAGRTLGDPAYRLDARRLATACVRRADRTGQFATQWQTDNWYNPGLFGGEAGVGYALLRSVDESLPCVLLWE